MSSVVVVESRTPRTAAYKALPPAVRRSQRRTDDIEPEYAHAMAGWAYVRLRRISVVNTVAAIGVVLGGGVSAAAILGGDHASISIAGALVAGVGHLVELVTRRLRRRRARTLVAALERVGLTTPPGAHVGPLPVHWRRGPIPPGTSTVMIAVVAAVAAGAWLLPERHRSAATIAILALTGILIGSLTIPAAIRRFARWRRANGVRLALDADGIAFCEPDERIPWSQVTRVYAENSVGTSFLTFQWLPGEGARKRERSIPLDGIQEHPEDVIGVARGYLAAALRGKAAALRGK